jgi:hypothetical protein
VKRLIGSGLALSVIAALSIQAARAQEANDAQREQVAANFREADADGDGAFTRVEFTRSIDLNARDDIGRARLIASFDGYGEQLRIIVTGSSRLEVYRRGGDSLMGRYLSYRMHPFSVAESLTKQLPDSDRIIRNPKKPKAADYEALWTHGGYPEP